VTDIANADEDDDGSRVRGLPVPPRMGETDGEGNDNRE
jgi:hypothetical protein